MRLTTHRLFQIAELADRAPHERIANYCRAIKAASIGNRGASALFSSKAKQWERILVRADARLLADRRAKGAA